MSSAGPPQRRSPLPEGAPDPEWEPHRWYVGGSFRGPSLTDVLERALDAGLVVDGDVRVDVGGIQDLITGRFRWVACSIDRTEAIGVDWWPLADRRRRRGGGVRAVAGRRPHATAG